MSEQTSNQKRGRWARGLVAPFGLVIALAALARALPGPAVDRAGSTERDSSAIRDERLASPAGALAPAGSDGTPAVRVVAQRTGCSERGLFVRWTLHNSDSRPRSGVLRAALRPDAGAPISAASEPQTVQLGAGESRVVTFRFARDAGGEDMLVALGVRVGAGQFDQIYSAGARFPCLRDCPAAEVMVRLGGMTSEDDAAVCARRGDWVGSIAVQDKESAYCSYEWQPLDGAEPDLDRFDDLDGADWEKDCLSIGAQASAGLQGGLRMQELVDTTDARLGIDDRNAIANDPELDFHLDAHPVRLAVIDTAARRFSETDADDNSDHGRVVGLVARRTACGDAAECAVGIDNRPALRIVYESSADERTYTIDAENGGYIGSQGQIARAINRTLRDWNSGREHLVINLSLGWHEKYSCRQPGCGQPLHVDMESRMLVPNGTPTGYLSSDGDAEGFGLGTRAVLVAIARARCMGALVFAAVGNSVAGNDRGPLLPAAWNGLDASRIDCARAFHGAAGAGHPTGGLVKAVAAVSFGGQRAALSRQGTLPFLVAHGVGVSVLDSRPRAAARGGFTGPLSGSSLATAVVSGAAALTWSLAGPDATAEEVFHALYEAGTPIAPDVGETEPPSSDLCGRGAHDTCRTPMEVDACSGLRAFQALVAAGRAELTVADLDALGEAVARCSGDRVYPQGEPTIDPRVLVSVDAERALETAGESSDGTEPFDSEGLVDMYEAPFSQPQPGPIRCATCALYRGLNQSQYQLDFIDAFSEDGTFITAAFADVLSEGYDPIPLSSDLITSTGRLQGLVDLTAQEVGSAPLKLIVHFPATPQGIPVSASELVETLLD